MKFSEIAKEELMALSHAQKWHILCSDVQDEGTSARVALLLGGRPYRAIERAEAAAKLYHEGRVNIIVPSGGVEWDYEGEKITEANLMARVLREAGVPDEAILLENEARTTKENMVFGTVQIAQKYRKFVGHVIIVTAAAHMKRSIALAKALFPRKTAVSAYPTIPAMSTEEWLSNEENCELLDSNLRILKDLIDSGFVEDMEIPRGFAEL